MPPTDGQEPFDLGGVDKLAGNANSLIEAAEMDQAAILLETTKIARSVATHTVAEVYEPAARQGRIPPVTGRQVAALDDDLPEAVGRHVAAALVPDAHFHVRNGVADWVLVRRDRRWSGYR